MTAATEFDTMLAELARARDAHEGLRQAGAPIAALSESSARLFQARFAMWQFLGRHSSATI